MYTAVPAKGKEPLPPANLSLISPPDPVAAPLKGSTVVGKLCVSAFRDITLLIFPLEKLLGVVASFGTNCSISGPSIKATLSLYADTILFGFFFDVFLINSKKILSKAIQKGGSSIRDFRSISGIKGGYQNEFKVYQREGSDCKRLSCKGIIQKKNISNRSTFFCNYCQK